MKKAVIKIKEGRKPKVKVDGETVYPTAIRILWDEGGSPPIAKLVMGGGRRKEVVETEVDYEGFSSAI